MHDLAMLQHLKTLKNIFSLFGGNVAVNGGQGALLLFDEYTVELYLDLRAPLSLISLLVNEFPELYLEKEYKKSAA